MVTVEHSLKFVTEFDETNPVAIRFLALDKKSQTEILEETLKEVMVSRVQPILDEFNEGASYAILKVVK
jgi:hypothetical protein